MWQGVRWRAGQENRLSILYLYLYLWEWRSILYLYLYLWDDSQHIRGAMEGWSGEWTLYPVPEVWSHCFWSQGCWPLRVSNARGLLGMAWVWAEYDPEGDISSKYDFVSTLGFLFYHSCNIILSLIKRWYQATQQVQCDCSSSLRDALAPLLKHSGNHYKKIIICTGLLHTVCCSLVIQVKKK